MPERWVETINRDELRAVARLMSSFPHPWFVSGGWAIDLFLGTETRVHEDLEIGIGRAHQGGLHDLLEGWSLFTLEARTGSVELIPWLQGRHLELPIHQIVARHDTFSPREFEFFLNEIWDGEWRFRKQPAIRRPLADTYLLTVDRIPIIAPEIQFLHKAGGHRPKDEADFRNALSRLDARRRSWLKRALQVYRPEDPWLDRLDVAG